jgi:hypothetical protein
MVLDNHGAEVADSSGELLYVKTPSKKDFMIREVQHGNNRSLYRIWQRRN